MSWLVMSREELQILMNDIHSGSCGKRRYFRGAHPFYGIDLFTLDFETPELTNIIEPSLFEDARRVRTPRGINEKEMIRYSDLKDCLLSSGVLRYENEYDVIEWLKRKRQDSVDPSEDQEFKFLAVDTNILYFRFISRHLSFRDSNGRPFHDSLRYMVSDIVNQEIGHRIHHTYTEEEISAFKSTFNGKELVSELLKANDLRGRKAKLAKIELDFVKYRLKASKASGTATRDSAENDRLLAEAYRDRVQIGHHTAYMLTGDTNVVDKANTCGMGAMQLVHPTVVPKHLRVPSWALRDLIYDIATLFTAFRLNHNEETITILGEWRGKIDDDHQKERVKVVFSDDDRYSSVERELRRCKSILTTMNEGLKRLGGSTP